MERKEKGLEVVEDRQRTGKKKEERKRDMVLIVGKRGGPSTPSPTWRLEFSSLAGTNSSSNNPIQEFLNTNTGVSARKLCANLWEIQPHLQLSLSKMTKSLRPRGARYHKKKKPFEFPSHLVEPPNHPPHQPASASPSRKHVTQSLMQHRRSVGKNSHASKHLSSSSCGSLMEVAPYKPLRTPSSSLNSKGKIRESSYSLKTSAELLKVLNRIWSLEEKQSCNMSLLKSLKTELGHSQSQIKELLKEKETSRREMDDLMKQVSENNYLRKNKEQDRIKSITESARKELEDERKLRKHSESLHRKIARELSEVKCAFSSALKELERERKARILLEKLCDEFAKGIRDYEQEVRSLRHKPELDHIDRGKPDRLVLHISEAWLDERMQMRLAEAQNNCAEKNTIVDKLSLDIETFLEARHSNGLRKDGSFVTEARNNNWSRRESFPLNEAVSAPEDAAEEGDSIDSDSRFELNKSAGKRQSISSSKRRGNISSGAQLEEIMKSDRMKRMAGSRENSKGRRLAGLHARFNLNDELDNLVRNHSMSSEGDKIHPEVDIKEDSYVEPVSAGHASPVQKWMSKLASPEFEKSESSLQLPRGVKENTLKAKLFEARLEGEKSRSKVSKASV
ncbi:uncharacterized protein At5g41620 [Ricinus communis]|uniref:uncharacterized protein At5g41620 n=1 Tax=Ricinus communis TaxID=3988 RepID=UPI00201AA997|nr:uncharacterized protein At5g41620 [Ricinus communis]